MLALGSRIVRTEYTPRGSMYPRPGWTRPQRSRATAIADTAEAPPRTRESPQAANVAPVVTTSSTRRIHRPATSTEPSPPTSPKAPATFDARSSRPSSNCAMVARRRASVRTHGRPSARAATSAISAAWSYPRRRSRSAWTGTGTTRSAPIPVRLQRRATAAPRGSASRRSPAYFKSCRAPRTGPAYGAHHSSWRSGEGISAGRPMGVPPGRSRRASSAGRHVGHSGLPSRPQPEQDAGKARSRAPETARRSVATPR